jgi:prevent-host-death family protein
MIDYDVSDARENFYQLIADVEKGEDVVITRNGKKIVMLVSLDTIDIMNGALETLQGTESSN